MTIPRESTESAIARIAAAAPDARIRVHRISAAELVFQDENGRAGVTLDEAGRRYFLTEVPETVNQTFGPGGPAFGMGRSYDDPGGIAPGVLIAGKSWSSSIAATHEKATGKWELTPNDPLSAFAYNELTRHGWHRVMSRRAAAILTTVAVAIVLIVVGIIAALCLFAAPWIGIGVALGLAVYSFGLTMQGARTPDQTLRKQVDTGLFWLSVLGPFGGTYLIHLAFAQGDRPLGVLGALVIVTSAAAQLFRR